jgi:hypothetical protein
VQGTHRQPTARLQPATKTLAAHLLLLLLLQRQRLCLQCTGVLRVMLHGAHTQIWLALLTVMRQQ